MKSGFVALFGKPNVGKSTIVNNLLKKKVSIVSPKAQTTRSAVKGIYDDEDSQIIFIDTPGVQTKPNKMGQFMNKMAYQAIQDVDAIVLVLDVTKVLYEPEEELLKLQHDTERPLIVVLNKIDLVKANQMAEIKAKCIELYQGATFIEMSALNKFNLDQLLFELKKVLPEGPLYYERGSLSDAPLKFLVAELIREKIMYLYDKEVPYSVLVYCDNVEYKGSRLQVDATILVERPSQKAILIGKGGEKLKKLNHQAKNSIHKVLDTQVDLSLFIKITKDWKEKESYIKMIRY